MQIDIDDLMPVFQRHIDDRLAADGDAGVVDQYIYPTHLLDDAIDQRLRLVRRGDIGLKPSRSAAEFPD